VDAAVSHQPDRDCPLCPRLVAFRAENRAKFPHWHNAPVPSFGPLDARLLIVGLGPGMRGANRTGRPFTGDFAGDLLYPTLLKLGFATGRFVGVRNDETWPGDTLELVATRVTNAVRCVPPQNKPLPQEITTCGRFLAAEIAAMPKLQAVVALGRIAHDAVLSALGARKSQYKFAHGVQHGLPGLMLADSYHCSRYNTNTGVLTPQMFEAVFAGLKPILA
jgi:uracil-DNA glycosylase